MSLLAGDACVLETDDYAPYEEGGGATCSLTGGETSGDGTTMEAEKRIRREIANSNERRRMQSINAGFQSLRTLLPRHEGEKLSKAAILQQTAEYIYSLEQEKTRLLSQNCQLKRLLNQHEGGEIPLKKRKTEASAPMASNIIPDSTEDTGSPLPVTMLVAGGIATETSESGELRVQLERERRLRVLLEEQVRRLEAQLFPESARDLSHHMTLHYATEEGIGESDPVKLEARTVVVEAPPPQVDDEEEVEEEEGAPLLEAAIKAEPRVEVEVLPDASHDTPSRLYLASTSRHNLETIVEAIRHLEGDHLFQEEAGELPLALTKKPEPPALQPTRRPHHVHHTAPSRPGVIVVKHS